MVYPHDIFGFSRSGRSDVKASLRRRAGARRAKTTQEPLRPEQPEGSRSVPPRLRCLSLTYPMIIAPAIFMSVAPIGLVLGNASALAIGQAPHNAGAASAILGALQFALGGIASPLTGLGGMHNALPMALVMVMVSAALLALLSFALSTPRNETFKTRIEMKS